jgi:hypothetical protein
MGRSERTCVVCCVVSAANLTRSGVGRAGRSPAPLCIRAEETVDHGQAALTCIRTTRPEFTPLPLSSHRSSGSSKLAVFWAPSLGRKGWAAPSSFPSSMRARSTTAFGRQTRVAGIEVAVVVWVLGWMRCMTLATIIPIRNHGRNRHNHHELFGCCCFLGSRIRSLERHIDLGTTADAQVLGHDDNEMHRTRRATAPKPAIVFSFADVADSLCAQSRS